MKIKELHLRNIASIERADIDFENGLNDAVTGLPATIFLISGDTGAGKSVILDGISMALYKKTPRTESTPDKNKNYFLNKEGENVRISCIEQYTRLGISEKEECYSEVLFEGNDGRDYRVRLTLGIYKTNRDKDTGERSLKYRAPVWQYLVEDGKWERVEANTGQPILDAVGLTFEQFGRMAMLAQGQFASFLTGNKAERESILEQLTNTELFSSYGEAVKSLYSKAKGERDDAKKVYETEKQHTLSEEELFRLNRELQETEVRKKALDVEINVLDEKYKRVELIEHHTRLRTEAVKTLQELEVERMGEEYVRRGNLVREWDATESVRGALRERKQAEQKKKEVVEQLLKLKSRFLLLSADRVARAGELELLSKQIATDEKMLILQQERETLYDKAEVVCLQLGQYKDKTDQREVTTRRLVKEKEQTAGLLLQAKDAAEAAGKANQQVEANRKRIDEVTRQRMDLNPEQVNKAIDEAHQKKQVLEDICSRINKLEDEKLQNRQLQQLIGQDEKLLLEYQKKWSVTEDCYQKARTENERVQSLLTTMKMSVEDTLVELRKRMVEEKVEVCPLCGQSIAALLHEEDFRQILSPLQQEEKTTKEKLVAAETSRNRAKGIYDKQYGILETNRKNLEQAVKRTQICERDLLQMVQAVELDVNIPLLSQLEQAVKEVTGRLSALQRRQQEAEALQQQIGELNKNDGLLDADRKKADREKAEVDKLVDQNKMAIEGLEKDIMECEQQLNQLGLQLSADLDVFYPEWKMDCPETQKNLKSDAEVYKKLKKGVIDTKAKLEREQVLMTSLETGRSTVLRLYADWDEWVEPAFFACRDIHSEWTSLVACVNVTHSELQSCEQTIRESSEVLQSYYLEKETSEASLLELIHLGVNIPEIRAYLNQVEAKRKSRNDAVRDADEAIAQTMKQLGVLSVEEIPVKEVLEAKKQELMGTLREQVEKIGSLKEQLNADRRNTQKLQESLCRLEKAEVAFLKWDKLNSIFGGSRFRTLVQTYILQPLLNNANIYLEQITDRYLLTCSEDNEQLAILVLDRYNKNQVRSVTVLSGGERFMISLALSLALSSLNRPDMNVNILFIDEGFGTLDEKSLDSVMSTLEKLQEIAGQTNRRVGIISHREELNDRLPVQIRVMKKGEGKSRVEYLNFH